MTKFIPQLAKTETFELPAGRYWIGDPCYVIDENQWDGFLEEVDCEETLFQFNNLDVVCAETNGDGCWDFDGKTYGIDAGLMAVIPAELVGENAAETGIFVENVDQVTVIRSRYDHFQGFIVGGVEIGHGFNSDEIVEYASDNGDYSVITTAELFAELLKFDEGYDEAVAAHKAALPQFA